MDISRIPPVFVEQISLCDWNSDVTRDDLIAALGDYPVYQEIIVAYVDDDDTFSSVEDVISAVPDQAWQDVQIAEAGDQAAPPQGSDQTASGEASQSASAG